MSCVRDRSDRDRKFLIWNFMGELLNKYDKACRENSSTLFKIGDFESTRLPIFRMDEPFIFITLKEYAECVGFIRIHDGFVALTSKGISSAKEDQKDWD